MINSAINDAHLWRQAWAKVREQLHDSLFAEPPTQDSTMAPMTEERKQMLLAKRETSPGITGAADGPFIGYFGAGPAPVGWEGEPDSLPAFKPDLTLTADDADGNETIFRFKPQRDITVWEMAQLWPLTDAYLGGYADGSFEAWLCETGLIRHFEVEREAEDESESDDLPREGEPLRVDLGGGYYALVGSALFKSEEEARDQLQPLFASLRAHMEGRQHDEALNEACKPKAFGEVCNLVPEITEDASSTASIEPAQHGKAELLPDGRVRYQAPDYPCRDSFRLTFPVTPETTRMPTEIVGVPGGPVESPPVEPDTSLEVNCRKPDRTSLTGPELIVGKPYFGGVLTVSPAKAESMGAVEGATFTFAVLRDGVIHRWAGIEPNILEDGAAKFKLGPENYDGCQSASGYQPPGTEAGFWMRRKGHEPLRTGLVRDQELIAGEKLSAGQFVRVEKSDGKIYAAFAPTEEGAKVEPTPKPFPFCAIEVSPGTPEECRASFINCAEQLKPHIPWLQPLLTEGRRVFGDELAFLAWLDQPNSALECEPSEMLTEERYEKVLAYLQQAPDAPGRAE